MLAWVLEQIGKITPEAWLDAVIGGVGIFFAILAAVWITPRLARRQAERSNQERVLRMLVNARLYVANPEWQTAIALIPIEFPGSKHIRDARLQYISHVSVSIDDLDPEAKLAHVRRTNDLQVNLISAVAAALKIEGLNADALIQDRYLSRGFADREELLKSALEALPEVANALKNLSHQHDALIRHQLASGQIWPTTSREGSGNDEGPKE